MAKIPEVVTVSDARVGLSRMLAELEHDGAGAEPVLIGAHRKPQGVLLSVEAYEALTGRAARRTAVDSATGSLAAEGLTTTDESVHDTEAYVAGRMSADDLVARAVSRHATAAARRAG
ncbi:type II toxin-antitoxin system Phd/YefM family antitoxin [Streptomyces sp. NBC_00083]|uniref:antitoxin VbhA family protein n=1 Tax=Streptomyces sp. NBC_00083 TaxID=2975647 RepID=UPI00224DA432|nr:type II toxin-antitoxin system Phd/YefM family antitoxin [Streptomyces sp. NBC_00083]MCX5382340.1 type II toxin-antitoxin system Phd/YefM family antitoxin [Streptomyces sp. NBC_00083]